jgi:hypothetical protein
MNTKLPAELVLPAVFARKQELLEFKSLAWRLVPLHIWERRIHHPEMVRVEDSCDVMLHIDVPYCITVGDPSLFP